MKLELNLVEDGREFLNLWDNLVGNDICCEIIDDELYLQEYVPSEDRFDLRKITLAEWLGLMRQRATAIEAFYAEREGKSGE